MVVGKFGNRTFDVLPTRIFTPSDISISGELETSTEDASGKKPSTTIKGPGLEKVSLEFKLLAVAGIDIQAEKDAWEAIRDAGTPYPLVLFGRAVSLNKYLLISVSLSDVAGTKANGQAVMSVATLKLDFDEYVAPGAKKSSGSKTSQKTSAPGLASQTVANPYKVPSADEKSTAKRKIGGAS